MSAWDFPPTLCENTARHSDYHILELDCLGRTDKHIPHYIDSRQQSLNLGALTCTAGTHTVLTQCTWRAQRCVRCLEQCVAQSKQHLTAHLINGEQTPFFSLLQSLYLAIQKELTRLPKV